LLDIGAYTAMPFHNLVPAVIAVLAKVDEETHESIYVAPQIIFGIRMSIGDYGATRTIPANKRLKSADPTLTQSDTRLIKHLELLPVECQPQV